MILFVITFIIKMERVAQYNRKIKKHFAVSRSIVSYIFYWDKGNTAGTCFSASFSKRG